MVAIVLVPIKDAKWVPYTTIIVVGFLVVASAFATAVL
jgi:hypothetical protein